MSSETPTGADIMRIMELLPHRYPFLMVDKVESYDPGKAIVAYKNVTMNEPFFQGHFPGLPVMPGVMILEALAQSGALLISLTDNAADEKNDKIFLFSGMEKVRFRRPVRPGDVLKMEVTDVRRKLNIIKMTGFASVDGQVAAQGTMSAALVDRENI